MTKADLIVERGATFLEDLARKAAAEGGFAAKLAEPLADDAAFLRKLKPSRVAARVRGEAPEDGEATVVSRPTPPPAPKPDRLKRAEGGPSPFLIGGAALATGILIAKWIDWRGHAHPRV